MTNPHDAGVNTGFIYFCLDYESERTTLSVSEIISVNLSLKSQQLKLISVLTSSRRQRWGQFAVTGR